MSLERYQQKRDFAKTPEPAGAPQPSDGPPRFVIQRHRARRLHYDFRLEVDGVLASWAVPKGVTLDPSVRHLAVHVEDHPMEYELFEGVIPGGEYGSGDVIVWDRGTFELHKDPDPATAIANGEVHAELFGEKVKGRIVMVRTKRDRSGKENWLLLHKRDEFAVEGWDPEDHPRSVLSGRTNDEVKADPERLWTREEGEIPAKPERPERAGPTDDELAELDALAAKGTWTVQDHELSLTNLDKQLFPRARTVSPSPSATSSATTRASRPRSSPISRIGRSTSTAIPTEPVRRASGRSRSRRMHRSGCGAGTTRRPIPVRASSTS